MCLRPSDRASAMWMCLRPSDRASAMWMCWWPTGPPIEILRCGVLAGLRSSVCDVDVTAALRSSVCDVDVDVLWRCKGGVRCCALHTCTLGEYRDSEIETELLLEGVEGLGQPLGLCRYLRAGSRRDLTVAHPDLLWRVNNRCLRPLYGGWATVGNGPQCSCYCAGCVYSWSLKYG